MQLRCCMLLCSFSRLLLAGRLSASRPRRIGIGIFALVLLMSPAIACGKDSDPKIDDTEDQAYWVDDSNVRWPPDSLCLATFIAWVIFYMDLQLCTPKSRCRVPCRSSETATLELQPAHPSCESLGFDDCDLDLARVVLRRGGNDVRIEPQVFNLLSYLIERRGEVVRKEELLDHVWGDRFVGVRSDLPDQVGPPGGGRRRSRSMSPRSPDGSTSVFGCSRVFGAVSTHAIRRCMTRSAGPTTCSMATSNSCSHRSPCSRCCHS